MKNTFSIVALALSTFALADYEVSLVMAGLNKPTGIAVKGGGNGATIYITQNPTPGVPGLLGGMNSVDVIRPNGVLRNIHRGEPDPVNLAIGPDDSLYWTCRSAGVILEQHPNGGISPLLTGLTRPVGLDLDDQGNVFFTQVPTPGIPGSMGGMNTVNVFNGNAIEQLTLGEPEPTDIAFDRKSGDVYWTCKSAGVILRRSQLGTVSLFLSGLDKPTGIDIDRHGNLYFTEVPTPGVSGTMGGMNAIWKVDIESGAMKLVNFGDPEPTDISVSKNGDIYWTCTSAGVVLRARE